MDSFILTKSPNSPNSNNSSIGRKPRNRDDSKRTCSKAMPLYEKLGCGSIKKGVVRKFKLRSCSDFSITPFAVELLI
jgi:hypothetical protein